MKLSENDITYDTSYWLVTIFERKSSKGPIVDERWTTYAEARKSFNEHKKRVLKNSSRIIANSVDNLITDEFHLDIMWLDSINNKIKELDNHDSRRIIQE